MLLPSKPVFQNWCLLNTPGFANCKIMIEWVTKVTSNLAKFPGTQVYRMVWVWFKSLCLHPRLFITLLIIFSLQTYHQGKCMRNWFWANVPPFLHSLKFLLQSVLITLAIYINFLQVCHKGKCLQKGTGAPAAPISHSLNPIFSTHPNALCNLPITLYLLTWVGVNLDVIT